MKPMPAHGSNTIKRQIFTTHSRTTCFAVRSMNDGLVGVRYDSGTASRVAFRDFEAAVRLVGLSTGNTCRISSALWVDLAPASKLAPQQGQWPPSEALFVPVGISAS